MNSVTIIAGLVLVMTPINLMTLGSSNWPIMEASERKSLRSLSVEVVLRVFTATLQVIFSGVSISAAQTSPNSPGEDEKKYDLKFLCEFIFSSRKCIQFYQIVANYVLLIAKCIQDTKSTTLYINQCLISYHVMK